MDAPYAISDCGLSNGFKYLIEIERRADEGIDVDERGKALYRMFKARDF